MEFKDYYQILGLEADADSKAIKTAYRKLARKYHPDLNAEDDAEANFKEVAEAYEVLKDAGKRAEYDELRKYGGRPGQGFEPPPGWESGAGAGAGSAQYSGDFSDFFNSIFGDAGFQRGSRQSRQDFGYKGQDLEIEMPVFLEDTLVAHSKPLEFGVPAYDNGRLVQRKKSLKVTIPAGVNEGERIRLKGQGGPGEGNAPAGDLYLHIRLVPHPLFDVEGHNVVLTVPLAPWEAALGSRITVPTLEGKINLTVAPNSQAGQKLRVKGKGLVTKNGRGDLYAVLKIVMPRAADAALEPLWQQLAEQAKFDPRAEWGKSS